MSNRSLLELNHDYAPPRDDAALLRWARQVRDYLSCADPGLLPPGVTRKHYRHHSEPCPVAALATEYRQPVGHGVAYRLDRIAELSPVWVMREKDGEGFVFFDNERDAIAAEKAADAEKDRAQAGPLLTAGKVRPGKPGWYPARTAEGTAAARQWDGEEWDSPEDFQFWNYRTHTQLSAVELAKTLGDGIWNGN